MLLKTINILIKILLFTTLAFYFNHPVVAQQKLSLQTKQQQLISYSVPKSLSNIIIFDKPLDISHVSFTDTKKQFFIKDFQNDVVVMYAWASFCGHCKKSMPKLNDLQKRIQDENIKIIALNVDSKGPKRALKFVNSLEDMLIEFYYINNNSLTNFAYEHANAFTILGVPFIFIINKKSEAVALIIGTINLDSPEIITFLKNIKKIYK
ncbi:TlpA disulfide reductase family protein [Bartonella sp. DGB1]|uniref:TlpA disulfide reductase family protein n=1 Tax=Bartonella sp. DGB1 TaxID=3239807 RepID=UPI003524CB21